MIHEHAIIKTRTKPGKFRLPKKEHMDVQANRIEQIPMAMTDVYDAPHRNQYLGFCLECNWIQMTKEEYEQWWNNRTKL